MTSSNAPHLKISLYRPPCVTFLINTHILQNITVISGYYTCYHSHALFLCFFFQPKFVSNVMENPRGWNERIATEFVVPCQMLLAFWSRSQFFYLWIVLTRWLDENSYVNTPVKYLYKSIVSSLSTGSSFAAH